MEECALSARAFAGFRAQSCIGCNRPVAVEEQRGKEVKKPRAEKGSPDLMRQATPQACEGSAEESPATNCSVGLGCIWRMVVRPEQTSLSADLFSG